jgi:HSP20 family protein
VWSAEAAMRVEEYRDGNTLVVRAEIPDVDPDEDITATYRDGILEVRLPVDEERARAVKVPVSR